MAERVPRTSEEAARAREEEGTGEEASAREEAPICKARRAMTRSTVIDIVGEALANTFYRRVVFTGENSQLVVMALNPHEDIGEERHRAVEQTLVVVQGFGTATLNGVDRPVGPGDAVVVVPETRHDITADAHGMKLYTVYAPPNHIDGTVHATKADAEADIEDHRFGEAAGGGRSAHRRHHRR